jgi:hypothetical protein
MARVRFPSRWAVGAPLDALDTGCNDDLHIGAVHPVPPGRFGSHVAGRVSIRLSISPIPHQRCASGLPKVFPVEADSSAREFSQLSPDGRRPDESTPQEKLIVP